MVENPYKYFFIEADELLDSLTRDILEFEKSPDKSNLLKALFRYAHTLKGAAHVVGLLSVSRLAHSIENLFSRARDQGVKLTSEDISLIIESLDLIKSIIKAVKKGESEVSVDITNILKRFGMSDTETLNFYHEQISRQKPNGLSPRSEIEDVKLLDRGECPSAQGNKENSNDQTVVSNEQCVSDTTPSSNKGEQLSCHTNDQVLIANGESVMTSSETVRVSLLDIDRLMNQASEFITGTIRLEQLHTCFKSVAKSCSKMLNDYRKIASISGFGSASKNQSDEFCTLLQRINIEALHVTLFEHTALLDANIEELKQIADSLYQIIHRTRAIRVSEVSHYFKAAVRDLSAKLHKKVKLVITGDELELDRNLIEEMKEAVNQIIRNAVVHGIEDEAERLNRGKHREGVIKLDFTKKGEFVYVTCEDDGSGISAQKIKEIALKKGVIDEKKVLEISQEESLYLIFASGISSGAIITEFAGRGVGLDIVREKVESLRGEITLETEEGAYTRFLVKLPLSLNMIDAFLIEVSGQKFLIPLNMVIESGYVLRDAIEYVAGKTVIKLNDTPVSFVWMSDILGLENKNKSQKQIPFVFLRSSHETSVFAVDQLLGVQKIIIKDLGEQLKNINNFLGGAILSGGCPALVLSVTDLFKISGKHSREWGLQSPLEEVFPCKPSRIMAVDDSLTTRVLLRGILETSGYDIALASSGEEALKLIEDARYDLFIIDVEMPGIDGFELAEKIRESKDNKDTPIIILSSLSKDEHRRKGIEVGAQAYIVKGHFDQEIFLETVQRLVCND
ncbi:MAG: response regulator [Thermodesulfobacteriota bacterium]|nr:response regulator [Thermodesulfobacteriota bacterium]